MFVAEAMPLFGSFEKCPQRRALPFAPYAGSHGPNIDDGQHQQKAQPLRALHLVREIFDGLRIGEIPLERC